MTAAGFVELERRFVRLEKVDAARDFEEQAIFGFYGALGWTELLEDRRVVLLAEAGADKTEEIREAAVKLRARGEPAFFIRLEYLRDGLEHSFDVGNTGSIREFREWLASLYVASLTGPMRK